MGDTKDNSVVLTMRGINKTFPGVKALNGAELTLRKGEIHALMGENGAGKSTLIKVLTGVYDYETGDIKMEGVEGNMINHSTLEAQSHGIVTVYQEINLCPNLTVAENLFVGRQPMKGPFIDWRKMNQRSKEIMDHLGINVDVTQNLENYSIAIQQMVAIARAVDMEAKVLILDEPTSSLDDNEVEKLFVLMNNLKEKGVSILFVTHFLEQVYAVCDRITVLRNGTFTGEWTTEELPRFELVKAMLGKEVDDLKDLKGENPANISDEIMVEAKGMSHKGTIHPFDFHIHKGEVVGFSGLLGSGRTEMARCIYGADHNQTGTLTMNGKTLAAKAPIDSIKAGMAYLPDDRKADGIIGALSVRENIILALQARMGMFHPIPASKQNEIADMYIDELQVKTPNREALVDSLSGGNQQKVIVGRWLATDPKFLILDEPTRGIDIGTKTEIQKLVLKLAEKGMSVVFISSEIDEMLRTCSRLCILRDGKKVGELDRELSEENVMSAIAGMGTEEVKA